MSVCYVCKSIIAIKDKPSIKKKKKKKKSESLKQDHIFKGSRKHTQPAKKMDFSAKFCLKEIYRLTSYKVTCDTKHNREKVTRFLREDKKIGKRKIKKIKN